MVLVSLALSAAWAQSFELTTDDMGTTVPLLETDLSYRVDVSDPWLDLAEVSLLTPEGETTLADVFDQALLDGAEVGDLMAISIDEREELQIAFIVEGGGGRTCVPLYEWRCYWVGGYRFCQWVKIGSTCCADGTTSCGDYILSPGE